MAVPKETIWEIEPHTIAKHKILEGYLKAWFPILSRYNEGINYIDGFAGPGKYVGGENGSPIIALEVAINHQAVNTKNIYFVFIEEDIERAKFLDKEREGINTPDNFVVNVINGKFHQVITAILDDLDKENKLLFPAFIFIDPFGFSGIPANIVGRLLSLPKVEVLINFSVDSINRFITTDEGKKHITELFDVEGIDEIINNHSQDRVRDLRDLYQLKLKTLARFVRYFEMRNADSRPIYYLFFASNSSLGHLKMKEAMWRVDKEGDFNFSDATDPNQIIMFERNDFSEEVFNLLKEKFGVGKFDVEILREFVENETPFLAKHLGQALRYGEANSLIEIDEVKKDGTKRRKDTFPDGTRISIK